MDPPPVQYIDRDGVALGYQVVGDGPCDVVMCFEIGAHLDLGWTDPHMHHQFERAAGYSRMVYTLIRGLGVSDPVRSVPSLEQQADDIEAVMDAAGVRRATLAGQVGTCSSAALVAARSPERVAGLVMWQPMACGPLGENALDAGWTPDTIDAFTTRFRSFFSNWGTGALAEWLDPALSTAANRKLMALVERLLHYSVGRFCIP